MVILITTRVAAIWWACDSLAPYGRYRVATGWGVAKSACRNVAVLFSCVYIGFISYGFLMVFKLHRALSLLYFGVTNYLLHISHVRRHVNSIAHQTRMLAPILHVDVIRDEHAIQSSDEWELCYICASVSTVCVVCSELLLPCTQTRDRVSIDTHNT